MRKNTTAPVALTQYYKLYLLYLLARRYEGKSPRPSSSIFSSVKRFLCFLLAKLERKPPLTADRQIARERLYRLRPFPPARPGVGRARPLTQKRYVPDRSARAVTNRVTTQPDRSQDQRTRWDC